MRARVLIGVAFVGLLVCGTAAAQEMVLAKNDLTLESGLHESSPANEVIINFIVTSANARLTGAEEGRLAAQKGTTEKIKAYGALMIKDQGRLLGELKRLAVLKGITIPEDIQENEIREKSGRQFDHAFVKLMIEEHERDIKLFKNALACGDPDVSAFAAQYLPLIESHLEKIKSIKR